MQQQEERLLPDVTRGQVLLTGVTAIGGLALDIGMHWDFGPLLLSAFGIFIAARHGGRIVDIGEEIVRSVVWGQDATKVYEATDRVVNKVMPQQEEHADQSAKAKIKRILGLQTGAPQEIERGSEEQIVAEPKLTEKKPRYRPHYVAPERAVVLADDLHVDVDDIAGKAAFIVGQRRSGKTTIGARLAEQLGGKFHIPLFIPDLEGDYLSLADSGILQRCIVVGHPDAYNPKALYMFAPIENITDAQLLGYDILENGLQVILDMTSYETVEQACEMSINIIKGIFAWTRRNPTELCPCEIYLDEAQRFLPENLNESIIQDPAVFKALLKVYMDITAVGGKRGLTPVILSQRFAQTNNKIMAQSEVRVIMRQTNDNDLERCMKYVQEDVAMPDQIKAFAQGQGVYIGADGTQLVTHFLPRESDGSRSRTPKAEAALRYANKPLQRGKRLSESTVQKAHSSEERLPACEQESHPPVEGLTQDVSPLVRLSEGHGETHETGETYVSLTEAERTTILVAGRAQMRETRKPKVNRSQLLRDLNAVDKSWNNKSWDKVKFVLDEEGI